MVHRVIIGLGFGDEGKGRIVDYLCATNDIRAVIRFSGGAQAAHNVVLPDGRQHTFAQFGSGTFHGVPTYLTQYMMINPFNLMREYDSLKTKVDFDPLDRLWVSEDAPVITVYHREANRLRETARGEDRHGSCGQGIGETRQMQLDGVCLAVGDLNDPRKTFETLTEILDRYTEEFGDDFLGSMSSPEWLTDEYWKIAERLNIDYSGAYLTDFLDAGDCVFEGSQGVLLDEWYGFHPYTTWSTTTPENALQILGERESRVIGVTRSYHTRHGAGPFPTESAALDETYPEEHNGTGEYQGGWRRGYLDLVLLRYAADACKRLDEVAVTHLDRPISDVVSKYAGTDVLPIKDFFGHHKTDLEYQAKLARWLQTAATKGVTIATPDTTDELIEMISAAAAAPVVITAYGPTWEATDVLQLQ